MSRLLLAGGFIAAWGSFLIASACSAAVIDPDDPGSGDVAFTIDATSGQRVISPKIYGINGDIRPSGIRGVRLGGNRWTGYNWETNNSNAGEDFFNYNDNFLVDFQNNTPPGEAVRPTFEQAASLGATTTVTVPIAGYVSADGNQEVLANQTAPSSRWLEVAAKKSSVYGGGSTPSLTPNENDNYVFTDEFVNWVEANRQGGQEVMYSLDNEPGLWDNTHPRLYGTTGPTFADYGQRAIAHASAIKDVAPDAKVLGGVTFGWDAMTSLNSAPDFDSQVPQPRELDGLHFNRWLLETMAAEEQVQGRPLMDVLDVHWYPEARAEGVRIVGVTNNTPAMIEARVHAPRSLWDPDYIEDSYITEFITKDYNGAGNDEGVELLNRINADIAELRPGTLLSISEYNYGGGNHISGGIAQADVLGVFGREGVYNANWWQIEGDSQTDFVVGGFEMFTDFDGQGGRFGDLSVDASVDDNAQSSVYASRSTENPDEMVIVAINRTDGALDAAIQITDEQRYSSAEIFQLTAGSATPVSVGEVPIELLNAFLYEMPAYSVSTIRLISAALAGDYNVDGIVNAADYTLWRDSVGAQAGTLANDVDGGVIGPDQYATWKANFGTSSAAGEVAVPEPAGSLLLVILCWGLARFRTEN